MTTNSTQCYEFQEPANMKAIRSSIVQRIKKRNEIVNNNDMSTLSIQPIDKKLVFLGVDSGLPSPPSESCLYEDDQASFSEIMQSPTATLESPPSPTLSKSSTQLESAEAIREKIRLLKQEKHVLFQKMKNLLSQPTPSPIERSASLNKEKEKPIIRSRSISHTEFSNRPRYNYYRSPPPRFYRPPVQPTSRRVVNNNSSYVSSRSQLIIRPSLSTSTSTFRPLNRHTRY